jgi:hypothetical protein
LSIVQPVIVPVSSLDVLRWQKLRLYNPSNRGVPLRRWNKKLFPQWLTCKTRTNNVHSNALKSPLRRVIDLVIRHLYVRAITPVDGIVAAVIPDINVLTPQ